MFVVRIVVTDGKTDFKAFSHKPDAQRWFIAAQRHIADGELESVAWFDVKDVDDTRAAVSGVKAGNAVLVDLYPKPPTKAEMEQFEKIMQSVLGENWKDGNANRT